MLEWEQHDVMSSVFLFPQTPGLARPAGSFARDLSTFHRGCRGRPVIPLLVPTTSEESTSQIGGATVIAPRNLARALPYFAERASGDLIDADLWLEYECEPLPTVVQAARWIFRDEPLPELKRAAHSSLSCPNAGNRYCPAVPGSRSGAIFGWIKSSTKSEVDGTQSVSSAPFLSVTYTTEWARTGRASIGGASIAT